MGLDLARWLSASAAVVGRAHELDGLECQDAVASIRRAEICAIGLADGAGSARHAAAGARATVSAALELVVDEFDNLIDGEPSVAKRRILDAVWARLDPEASRLGATRADLAATLLFVAVKRGRFLAGQVGDGVVAVRLAASAKVLAEPSRGEHLNETVFVTSEGAARRMTLARGSLDDVRGFALMSDGAAESLHLRHEGRLAPALGAMWSWLERRAPAVVERALAANASDVLRASTRDDCSVALMQLACVPAADVGALDPAMQMALLDCRSARGLRTRRSVLEAMTRDPAAGARELAEAAGVSRGTAASHARALRAVLRPGIETTSSGS